MSTLTLSRSSPTNTTLTDSYGTVFYEVSTPLSLCDEITTIKRNGQVLAIIKWRVFEGSQLTMGGMTAPLSDVFPKSGILSNSRVFTTASGERLKWKCDSKRECVSADSGLPLATFKSRLFGSIGGKKSTLEISPNATHLLDILVVTWVIIEKKREDRKVIEAVIDGGSSA
ncbi:unnamed protein product [Rhizoctonia solani]|uniref:DUF6593 domain-containing protein n=1 Tax=Rhizoctonia solani TaxID=456999 RepID=A0A8H3AUJ7_9AGAM|nr:unnamed protein product [Rhizoctonia solani]